MVAFLIADRWRQYAAVHEKTTRCFPASANVPTQLPTVDTVSLTLKLCGITAAPLSCCRTDAHAADLSYAIPGSQLGAIGGALQDGIRSHATPGPAVRIADGE